jgi:quinohemoprotein ethanol dehydrogenase
VEQVKLGKSLFAYNCAACHGAGTLSSGVLPDLKRSMAVTQPELWQAIVISGAYKDRGMASFAGAITTDEAELIRAYVGSESLRIQGEASAAQ